MTVQRKKSWMTAAGSLLAVGLLSATLMAQSATASRNDAQIQNVVAHKMAAKKQFGNVKSSVEDGIVTLTGTVDLYQRKLDAAKLARKTANVQGVRNLIMVEVPMCQTRNWKTNWQRSCVCASRAMTARLTTSRLA